MNTMLSPFSNSEDYIEEGPSLLKLWTNSRDFPLPDSKKESFRTWMKEREGR